MVQKRGVETVEGKTRVNGQTHWKRLLVLAVSVMTALVANTLVMPASQASADTSPKPLSLIHI